ncbi:MAG: CinA family protein [Catonella sp.]|uniref:CinA family protein n=1 Tax=Catonella sp. TaxID=2382125 RepID=UPI003FA118FC
MKLEEEVVKNLLAENLKITTAESCTGGLIAARLVDVSGASGCFNEGYITYANEAKIRLLGVKEESIREFGAVSDEVVIEMAEGALSKADADLAVAVSGIAGPLGGSKEKPVGTVHIGLCMRDKSIGRLTKVSYRFLFDGDRTEIRNKTVEEALKIILSAI